MLISLFVIWKDHWHNWNMTMSPWRITGSQTRALPSRHVESSLGQTRCICDWLVEAQHQLSTQTCHPPFPGTKLLITTKRAFISVWYVLSIFSINTEATVHGLRCSRVNRGPNKVFWTHFSLILKTYTPLEQTTVKQEVFISSHQVKTGGFGGLI